ncbi:hypothetical protein LTS18_003227, partial [Coniosporium uncinatum]
MLSILITLLLASLTAASPLAQIATGASSPTSTAGSTPAAAGPGSTLQSGYYWVRAVTAPNFHKYLQTSPNYAAGPAVLQTYTTAGQFQIIVGQLVQLTSAAGAAAPSLLYAGVAQEKTKGGRTLAVTFSPTKNTYGTFAWQGDALTWSAPGLTRPQASA